eukprot:Skav214378  [mRNA]  locus=scaffold4284:76267:76778:- [translate_table: standard]
MVTRFWSTSRQLGVEAAPFLAKRLLGSDLRDGGEMEGSDLHRLAAECGKAQGLKSEPAIQRTCDDP